jgi:hypothetical protein
VLVIQGGESFIALTERNARRKHLGDQLMTDVAKLIMITELEMPTIGRLWQA